MENMLLWGILSYIHETSVVDFISKWCEIGIPIALMVNTFTNIEFKEVDRSYRCSEEVWQFCQLPAAIVH